MSFLANMNPKTKKILTIGIPILLGIVGIYLAVRHSSSSSTTAATGSLATVPVAAAPVGGTVDTGGGAPISWAPPPTLDGSAPVPAAAPAAVVAPAPVATPAPSVVGSGYAYNAPVDGYSGIPDGQAAAAAQASGLTLYFSPAAGVFAPDTPTSDLAAGTELYLQNS